MKSWSRIQRINKQIPSSWYGDYPPGVVPGALPGFLVKSHILAPTMDASRMTGSKEESTSADKKTELLSKKPQLRLLRLWLHLRSKLRGALPRVLIELL